MNFVLHVSSKKPKISGACRCTAVVLCVPWALWLTWEMFLMWIFQQLCISVDWTSDDNHLWINHSLRGGSFFLLNWPNGFANRSESIRIHSFLYTLPTCTRVFVSTCTVFQFFSCWTCIGWMTLTISLLFAIFGFQSISNMSGETSFCSGVLFSLSDRLVQRVSSLIELQKTYTKLLLM